MSSPGLFLLRDSHFQGGLPSIRSRVFTPEFRVNLQKSYLIVYFPGRAPMLDFGLAM